MPNIIIRDATPADFEIICAMNLAEVRHTSAMDLPRLAQLHDLSCHHKVVELNQRVSAFLLAMRSGAPYVNANFDWFAERYANFIYIDRVVVSAAARGLGLGSLMYEDIFAHARAMAIPLVTCEYNIVPPNEPSRLFHARFGFKELGTQWVGEGAKRVSLQGAEV